jgi:H+/gluconate symporter-like permease
MPLVVPILGVPFLIAGFPFVIGGLLFVAMALAPLVIEWRAAGLQRVFLGTTNATGIRFRERDSARASMFMPGTPNPPDAVTATSADWGLSLGLALIPAVVGALLAYAVFTTAG